LTAHLSEIRQRFAVKRLSLFGSLARDDARENSDVDLVVEFEGKATFDGFMNLKFYIEDLLGTRVDLVTEKALRPAIRREVEREAVHVA